MNVDWSSVSWELNMMSPELPHWNSADIICYYPLLNAQIKGNKAKKNVTIAIIAKIGLILAKMNT